MGLLDSVSGFFTGAFSYADKKGRVWWLHVKKSPGGVDLYYFSRVQDAAIPLPGGHAVVESKTSGIPLLKKG